MVRNPRLDEAVAVFVDLGWADAIYADVPTLPPGTEAQRKVALAGLCSGSWSSALVDLRSRRAEGRDDPLAEERAERASALFDAEAMLWLFAVRVGVSPSRALATMPLTFVPHDLAFTVLADRGPEFARVFVAQAPTNDNALWDAMRLVARHQLPFPERWETYSGRGYLEEWVYWLIEEGFRGGLCEIFCDRFAEHVRAAMAAGLDVSRVIPDGVARGWATRDEAVDLVLVALDTAARPTERKVWLDVWLDDLHATDDEIVGHAQTLVPVLATGDVFVVERLAPVLIAGVDDDLLADVVTVALTGRTKKARRTVLAALARRPVPGVATVEALEPVVAELAAGADQTLARAACTLAERWALVAQEPASDLVTGLWKPVPPVWQVPRFDHGDETSQALASVWRELVRRAWSEGASSTTTISSVDIVVERYLAVANAVVRHDLDGARAVLDDPVLENLEGDDPACDARPLTDPSIYHRHWCNQAALLAARARQVRERFGHVPCLLSEPSTVDLAIAPADLVVRLRAYLDAGVPASEADLFLALTRLDTNLADEAARAEIQGLDVPVVTLLWDSSGWAWYRLATAGAVVVEYLDDPMVEPAVVLGDRARLGHVYGPEPIVVPQSLRHLQPQVPRGWAVPTAADRLSGFPESHPAPLSALFPTWTGDATQMAIRTDEVYGIRGGEGLHAMVGPVVRQLVRRATPLPPGASANLLVMQRSVHPRAAADVAMAVGEAWERGLLRPGVADVALLGWAPDGCQHRLAATTQVLARLAGEGMLAVVWPVLDDLLVAATSAPRLVSGAAEVAQAIATLLPEVLHAVATGLAAPEVLTLPGIRALAARTGSSQAVKTARAVVAQLPRGS
ncbi:MAG: hypothetical protein FWD11_09770 [Micrococcales bacterium]|nr:hypothetical protein [Micrococcales bacterium]